MKSEELRVLEVFAKQKLIIRALASNGRSPLQKTARYAGGIKSLSKSSTFLVK